LDHAQCRDRTQSDRLKLTRTVPRRGPNGCAIGPAAKAGTGSDIMTASPDGSGTAPTERTQVFRR